jgi:dTDP-4-amino-4,6-dideoxygalactose transaminase
MIPFVDLGRQHEELLPILLPRIEAVLRSGRFVGGPELEAFEHEFAQRAGSANCAGVASGTDALRFALLALGVGPGDEVITVPQTFIATTEAISQAGGTIRFVDIHPDAHTMDPTLVEAAITSRTVGIVPVHLYGRPADMDAILAVARRHGLWVVEDAAQAHSARYRGRPVGTLGDAGCFSFYPGKNLGACGEAGAVISGDPRLIEEVRALRDHGQHRKYAHRREGYTGRLDAIQAAILRVKLEHLTAWTEARRRVARWYGEALRNVEGIEPPVEPSYAWSVFHLYAVQAADRDGLRDALKAAGIATGVHYPTPLHLQEAYRHLRGGPGAYPVAERVAAHTLSLPMFPELTRAQVDEVAAAVRAFVTSRRPPVASRTARARRPA